MTRFSGIIFALLASVCWAVAIILSKYSLEGINSNQLFFIQIISAAVVSTVLLLIKKEKLVVNKKAMIAYSTGFFEPFLAYLLTLYGLTLIPAGIESVIISIESIMIMLLSILFLKNKISSPMIFSILTALAFIGCVIMIYPDIQASGEGRLIGYFASVGGVFCASIYVVISSKLVKDFTPHSLLTGQLIFSVILSLLFILPFVSFQPVEWHVFIIAILSGILQYYLAFHFYLLSLKLIKVHIAGMMLYLIPVIAIFLSYLFLKETISGLQFVGIVIILSSVICINYRYDSHN